MITKLATSPTQSRVTTRFYSSAREAMALYLEEIATASTISPQVVLPAFIGYSEREGSGVFDPVRSSGLQPVFYSLKDDLSVDLSSLKEAVTQVTPGSVVVLIHYFGRTDPGLAEVAALCRDRGLHLLEDLAHAYFTHHLGSPAGRTGHAAIYSLHKMLPVADGGMLQIRGSTWSRPSTRPELSDVVLSYDNSEIAVARRRNYDALHRGVVRLSEQGFPCRPLWAEIGPTDAPQTMPMVLEHHRDDFYDAMNERGLGVVSLYHTLIPQLPQGFVRERRLAKYITNLPIHQDIGPSDVDRLIDETRAVLAGE